MPNEAVSEQNIPGQKVLPGRRRPNLDRWLWVAMLLAAAVVIPRSILVSRAHSEYLDDEAHLRRGFAFITRNPFDMYVMMTDPPLGDGILVAPLAVMGNFPSNEIAANHWPGGQSAYDAGKPASPQAERRARTTRTNPLYGEKLSPESILMIIAIWKSILFIPFAGLVFHWARWLYGLHSAWLALALLLIEPTVAAHISPIALDTLGLEGIAFALFLCWRYFESPSRARLIGAAIAVAIALLIKHTAIIVPAIVLIYAVIRWSLDDRRERLGWRARVRQRVDVILLGSGIVLVSIWVFSGFEISRPRNYVWPIGFKSVARFSVMRDVIDPLMDVRLPAGMYIGSLVGAIKHSTLGHWGYLFGEHRETGWWYYQLVVATYKVPIGVGIILALGLVSLIWVRPRFEELSLLVPMLAYVALMLSSTVDIGFRHFIPPLVFMMMLASRCLIRAHRIVPILAWGGAVAAMSHALTYHPDYMSYINYPREKPYLAINDSNIDWGQSLKQVRTWLDTHPHAGRNVYLGYFWNETQPGIRYYLGDRVIPISRTEPHPMSGLLIVSPAWVAGLYDWFDAYGALRPIKPIDTIGHNMLVYDPDELRSRGFQWPVTTQPIAK